MDDTKGRILRFKEVLELCSSVLCDTVSLSEEDEFSLVVRLRSVKSQVSGLRSLLEDWSEKSGRGMAYAYRSQIKFTPKIRHLVSKLEESVAVLVQDNLIREMNTLQTRSVAANKVEVGTYE